MSHEMRNSIFFVLLGVFLGATAYSCTTIIFKDEAIEYSCSTMEETKLKMALNECSDIVMGYVWEDNIETR